MEGRETSIPLGVPEFSSAKKSFWLQAVEISAHLVSSKVQNRVGEVELVGNSRNLPFPTVTPHDPPPPTPLLSQVFGRPFTKAAQPCLHPLAMCNASSSLPSLWPCVCVSLLPAFLILSPSPFLVIFREPWPNLCRAHPGHPPPSRPRAQTRKRN